MKSDILGEPLMTRDQLLRHQAVVLKNRLVQDETDRMKDSQLEGDTIQQERDNEKKRIQEMEQCIANLKSKLGQIAVPQRYFDEKLSQLSMEEKSLVLRLEDAKRDSAKKSERAVKCYRDTTSSKLELLCYAKHYHFWKRLAIRSLERKAICSMEKEIQEYYIQWGQKISSNKQEQYDDALLSETAKRESERIAARQRLSQWNTDVQQSKIKAEEYSKQIDYYRQKCSAADKESEALRGQLAQLLQQNAQLTNALSQKNTDRNASQSSQRKSVRTLSPGRPIAADDSSPNSALYGALPPSAFIAYSTDRSRPAVGYDWERPQAFAQPQPQPQPPRREESNKAYLNHPVQVQDDKEREREVEKEREREREWEREGEGPPSTPSAVLSLLASRPRSPANVRWNKYF